jgi:hypothetical protein
VLRQTDVLPGWLTQPLGKLKESRPALDGQSLLDRLRLCYRAYPRLCRGTGLAIHPLEHYEWLRMSWLLRLGSPLLSGLVLGVLLAIGLPEQASGIGLLAVALLLFCTVLGMLTGWSLTEHLELIQPAALSEFMAAELRQRDDPTANRIAGS